MYLLLFLLVYFRVQGLVCVFVRVRVVVGVHCSPFGYLYVRMIACSVVHV